MLLARHKAAAYQASVPGLPLPEKVKESLPYRFVRGAYYFRDASTYKQLRQGWRRKRNHHLLTDYLAITTRPMLQIGSGNGQIEGWLNSDYYPDSENQYHLDASKSFDIPDESFDLVYCEHMIEHITFPQGLAMLKECYRILKPGGRIRVATPPLSMVTDLASNPTKVHRTYIDWHMDTWLPHCELRSEAVVANDFMRNWGHVFIYDEPTLRWSMAQAGFSSIEAVDPLVSTEPALRGLERLDRMPPGLYELTTFIVEASKR